MQNTNEATAMRIGQLAAAVGLNPKTIRYYEELGLLPPPQRSIAGYRLYGEADRARLDFIGKAKTIGLTLAEIRDILLLHRDGAQPCAHVRSLLDRKLAAVDAQLRGLTDVRQVLLTLREDATGTMAAEACICGIIEQHQTEQ